MTESVIASEGTDRRYVERRHATPKVLVFGSFLPESIPCGMTNSVDAILQSPLRTQFACEKVALPRHLSDDRHLLQRLVFGFRLFARTASRIVTSGARLVDIHAVSDRDFLKNSAVFLAAWITRRPTVLHIHGGDFDRTYGRSSVFIRLLTRWVLRHASRVALLSTGWEEIIRSIEPKAKTVVLPNAVRCDELASMRRSAEGQPTILLLGNLCERKGHFDALEAFALLAARFPDARMVFAGAERDAGALGALRERAESLGIQERVVFAGPVLGRDKERAIGEASLMILPSHTENMPLSVIEAMAAGLPIVATRVGAIPEMIEHGRNGILIDPRRVDALAESLAALLDNPQERARIGSAAQKHAYANWDATVVASEYETVFRELLPS